MAKPVQSRCEVSKKRKESERSPRMVIRVHVHRFSHGLIIRTMKQRQVRVLQRSFNADSVVRIEGKEFEEQVQRLREATKGTDNGPTFLWLNDQERHTD